MRVESRQPGRPNLNGTQNDHNLDYHPAPRRFTPPAGIHPDRSKSYPGRSPPCAPSPAWGDRGVYAGSEPNAVCRSSEGNLPDAPLPTDPHRLWSPLAVAVDPPGSTGTSSLASEFSHLTKQRKPPRRQAFTGVPLSGNLFRMSKGPMPFPSTAVTQI